MWDVGGQERIRALWKHYYHGTNAVIFMVDSCDDADRLAEARAELNNMMGDDELRDVCVLVFANKQDLPNALPAQKVCIRASASLSPISFLPHAFISFLEHLRLLSFPSAAVPGCYPHSPRAYAWP